MKHQREARPEMFSREGRLSELMYGIEGREMCQPSDLLVKSSRG